MKTSDPSIDEEHPADQGHGREDLKQVRESFKAGTRLDDFCYYYTCLYVGLTLFHGATIRNDSDKGKAEKEKLGEVLVTMSKVKQPPCVLPDSVSKMCQFLGMSCSAQGSASTASSSKEGAQPPPKHRRGDGGAAGGGQQRGDGEAAAGQQKRGDGEAGEAAAGQRKQGD